MDIYNFIKAKASYAIAESEFVKLKKDGFNLGQRFIYDPTLEDQPPNYKKVIY